MKCHAGIEFESGKPCPKCNAKLGEVCWPGINADLLELPKVKKALQKIADQMLTSEMDLESAGDFEGAYDIMIGIARSALSPAQRNSPGEVG